MHNTDNTTKTVGAYAHRMRPHTVIDLLFQDPETGRYRIPTGLPAHLEASDVLANSYLANLPVTSREHWSAPLCAGWNLRIGEPFSIRKFRRAWKKETQEEET